MPNILGASGQADLRYRQPAFYQVAPDQIVAAGIAPKNLQTDSDSDFLLSYFLGTSDLDDMAAAAPLLNNFAVQAKFSGGREITNGYIQQIIFCPVYYYSRQEPWEIIIPASTIVEFSFQNLSVASAINIKLVLKGYKLFGG